MKIETNFKETEIGKIPEDWEVKLLSDVAEFSNGKGVKKNIYIKGINYPIYGANGIIGGTDNYNSEGGIIVIGRVGAYGELYLVNGKIWVSDNAIKSIPNNIINLQYLYYFLKTFDFEIIKGGAVQPLITQTDLKNSKIPLPSLPEQEKIADFLGTIDDKIALNNSINKKLEETAQALFKSRFIDFEPFKDGEFIDSEMGKIPKGWRVGKLGEMIDLQDNKRRPLSGTQRDKIKGIYPYYGATSIMDYINDYIFDGKYLLIAEDGTVIDKEGFPILQFIRGKFWANNHTHIISENSKIQLEYLYLYLKTFDIKPFITGAVQLKLNGSNLKSIPLLIPNIVDIENILFYFKNNFNIIYINEIENQKLTEIKKYFLPKLISGEIRLVD